MTALCALAGTVMAVIPLPDGAFTLSWQHSVEKVRWEEDYAIRSNHLVLMQARIKGSGAGMEPPPDAVRLPGGWWAYRPDLAKLPALSLAASAYAGDYRICVAGSCKSIADYLRGRQASGVTLKSCGGSGYE